MNSITSGPDHLSSPYPKLVLMKTDVEYQPIDDASNNVPSARKRILSFIGIYTLIASFLIVCRSAIAHSDISSVDIDPISGINCTEIISLPLCNENPRYGLCESCARRSIRTALTKNTGCIEQPCTAQLNPTYQVSCSEIASTTVCSKNTGYQICKECSLQQEAFKALGGFLSEPKTHPISYICDFVDEQPICDKYESSLPCEACECLKLKEEGKCYNPINLMKCLRCVKKFA